MPASGSRCAAAPRKTQISVRTKGEKIIARVTAERERPCRIYRLLLKGRANDGPLRNFVIVNPRNGFEGTSLIGHFNDRPDGLSASPSES